MIAKDEYVEKLKNSMWDNNVKVITGVRRCGKSILLFDLFCDYLLKSLKINKDHIIKIKLDERRKTYLNPDVLDEYVRSLN